MFVIIYIRDIQGGIFFMEGLHQLIKHFQKTNEFDEVYHLYEKKIYFLSKSFNIEEYQSDLFYNLWILAKKVDLNKLTDDKSLGFYIFKSLKNYSINYYNKKKLESRVIYNSEVTSIEIDKSTTCPFDDSHLIFNDMTKHLSSEKQINIINLRYLNGLSDIEIADKLNISRQAVHKSRLCALKTLKQCI